MNQTMTIQFYDMMSRFRAHKLQDAPMRDDMLTSLHRFLRRERTHHVVITGAPGSGKTRFIEAFAYRQQQSNQDHISQKIYVLKTDPLINHLFD
jgi:ATP-dependent Clp protease ATP-binding subunit ClpA